MSLENAAIIALIVYFIKATTWPGMIFEKVGVWAEDTFGEYWNKPILGCPVCMTPWWGTALYLFFHFTEVGGFEDIRAQVIAGTVLCSAGLNVIVLMLNKEYDVAKKEDKILENETSNRQESNQGKA